MKFLKFVSCCGGGAGGGEVKGREVVAETAAAVRRNCRRKRGRVNGGAEWKATLGSISEDNVPVVAERAAERAVKRKSGSADGGGHGSSCVDRRDSLDIASIPKYDEDDYRRGRYTTIIPAFAPTPFML